nr:ribonuclease H-like domain-containing protein [Tanacetum cinerariifolium]
MKCNLSSIFTSSSGMTSSSSSLSDHPRCPSTLLMALPDKHQLKFNIHKDAKTLMEAVEKRFGGNKETKKMRIKQYFLMTDYSLWEVILNGDSPAPTRVIEESLFQKDINLKFLRSIPTEWRTHTLIWRNKADLEEQSLDDLFNNLEIDEAEVKSSSSASTSTQNIAFVSSNNTDSTNEPVNVVDSVSATSAKLLVCALPNVDTLSNDVDNVGNKIHKAFPLPAIKFPLPEELPTASEDGSHCQKKRDATARKTILLSKTRKNCQSKKDGSYTKLVPHVLLLILAVTLNCNIVRITFNTHLTFTVKSKQDIDQQYPTVAKIHVLDTRKFKQWQFRMQQYLQHEHYVLWEEIEFEDSYEAPANDPSTTTINTTSGEAGTKSGRTFTLTTEDMQKKKNDVMAAILKTFGGNEATKKTNKNLLKQQYGNFRAEGSETLEQTFTRLQVIVVWKNMSDLDTMSLDDLYNHLKVYETEVQKKTKLNTQNMAFISSAKHNKGNDEVNTASVYTASSNVPTASANIATVSISQETTCAYIASGKCLSQPLPKSITYARNISSKKKTGKKISIQGSDVAWFDKSKVKCFNCHKMSHFARKCRAPRNQDRGRRDNYRQGSKAEEHAAKANCYVPSQLKHEHESVLCLFCLTHQRPHSPSSGDNEFHNRNHSGVLPTYAASCSAPFDPGCIVGFCDRCIPYTWCHTNNVSTI